MLSLDDPRWASLHGGYRVAFDVRSALRALEIGHEPDDAWRRLWNELHHQGDVDLASYAAVPHLVRLYAARRDLNWNTYALVGIIALLAGRQGNPPVPEWLEPGFSRALHDLSELARDDLAKTDNALVVRTCLGVIALAKGLTMHATLLLEFDDSEVDDLVRKLHGAA